MLRRLSASPAFGLLALAMSACAAQTSQPPAQENVQTLGQCRANVQDLSNRPLPARAICPNIYPWTSPEDAERIFEALADLKVRFIRFDFTWPALEPTRGNFDWHIYDGFVKQAHQHGIRILAVAAFSPGWANGGGPRELPPTDLADWNNFLRELVGHYMPCGDLAAQEGWTDGYGIQAWEIWNEPNLFRFWAPVGDPVAYTRLLTGSYQAVKAVDPRSLVLNGGLAMPHESGDCYAASCFIGKMYANGAKNYFDAMALHPYTGGGPPDEIQSLVGTVRGIMDANDDAEKPIWLTEFGYVTAHLTEAEQADYLERTYGVELPALVSANNVRALFWYSLRDGDEELYGLLHHDFSRKQSYGRYRDSLPSE
jgi:hypothetical protein